ncbi:hypothetical protein TSUD_287800 [Trifolium subterraneum]|uniref:Uncharacterized protein n=1 Tax=Trifolium subterraneum TaxID=3900 RepID=A0A2Z6NEX9_TRISU|nr:hypothetical protein TSUD_287800 [Trifolium subterraneum]
MINEEGNNVQLGTDEEGNNKQLDTNKEGKKFAIGIDLGTTNSRVAVWRNDQLEIICNDQGNRTTPSYVAFTDSQRMIGDSAFNMAACNPTNTVYGIAKQGLTY